MMPRVIKAKRFTVAILLQDVGALSPNSQELRARHAFHRGAFRTALGFDAGRSGWDVRSGVLRSSKSRDGSLIQLTIRLERFRAERAQTKLAGCDLRTH